MSRRIFAVFAYCTVLAAAHSATAQSTEKPLALPHWPSELIQKLLDFESLLLKEDNVEGACIAEGTLGAPRLDLYVSGEVKAELPGVEKKFIPVGKRFFAQRAKMGTSTSNNLGPQSAGTLGIIVTDNKNPSVLGYLTCNHVAAGVAGCPRGFGSKQVAPGTQDHPLGWWWWWCRTIGKLERSSSIKDVHACYEVDAAFVRSNHRVDAANACGLCAKTTKVPNPYTLLGKTVMKCGRTTHLTCGKVTGVGCTVKLEYGACDELEFVNQVRVQNPNGFSRGGDSGAAVFTAEGAVMGLLIGGDDDTITWVTPMDLVLKDLDVSLVLDEGCSVEPECPED